MEPRLILDEPRDAVQIPELPPHWHGRRVAVLADLQIGMWLANQGMIRRAVGRVVEGRPAAVLLATSSRPIVAAGIPAYTVLGNHGYLTETPAAVSRPDVTEALAQSLRKAGVTLLCNEAVAMNLAGGSPLYLVASIRSTPGVQSPPKCWRRFRRAHRAFS